MMILIMSILVQTRMLGNKLLSVRRNPQVSTFFLKVQSIWESRNKGSLTAETECDKLEDKTLYKSQCV